MDSTKVYGIIISSLCVCIVFKNLRTEYSLFIRLLTTIGVSVLSVSVLYPIIKYINEISYGTKIEEYFPTLIKALGIAITTQITADTCKDAGEEGLASRVYLFGQAEILILCIPVIKTLFALLAEII